MKLRSVKHTTYFLILFLLISGQVMAQFTIQGTVIDKTTNARLGGITITDVDTNKNVITDADGLFSIETTGTLQVSGIGYKTQQLSVTEGMKVIISLETKQNELDAVVISTHTIEKRLEKATESIAIVSGEEIRRENTVALAPILNRVPGVYMQSGALNTNRITIRGIGARSPFSTANIRGYYADIPLTDGNGESAIEDLELASVSRMEIQKGPASSSYGVGLGGTILLHPEFSKFNNTQGTIKSTVGSYGLFRTIAKVAHGGNKANVNVIYSNTHSDGYRNNNSYDRATLTATSNWFINENNELSFLGNYTSLKAFIPSSLNKADFDSNPRKVATFWQRAQGFEDAKKTIFGINWKHQYTPLLVQKTSVFVTNRNAYEPRPFNILEEKTTTYGIRTRLLATEKLGVGTLKWTVGGELFRDDYNAKKFQNLYEDFPEGTGSIAGDLFSNIDEDRNYYNVFAEAVFNTHKWTFNLGLHLNSTYFKIDDRINELTNTNFTFDPIVSPKFGVNYEVQQNVHLFGTIAHGFSTPTTEETLMPNGVFNPNIKAERGWNFEVGSRFKTSNRKLSGTISLYKMSINDLLVNRRTSTDENITINAGKTSHNGIEASLSYQIYTTTDFSIQSFGTVSINDFKFNDFIDGTDDFSGNDLTGVPKSVVNLGIEAIAEKGFFGNLTFQSVGKMPANDRNTVYSNSFELLNGKIGYQNFIGTNFEYQVSIGANNLLDTKYASQLQVNAFGNDTSARYFYPGLPFNMYGSVQLNYRF